MLSSIRPRLMILVTTLALVGALFNLAACKSKEKADKAVDDLVSALQDGDYDKLKDISDASLLDDIDPDKFALMAATVKQLGDFKERTMKSINVENNVTNGTYTLDFDKGEVTLQITLVDSNIAAFEFQGDAVSDAMREVMSEKGAP